MAPKQLYPRATVRKIIKAHIGRPVSKNVDVLVCLTDIQLRRDDGRYGNQIHDTSIHMLIRLINNWKTM